MILPPASAALLLAALGLYAAATFEAPARRPGRHVLLAAAATTALVGHLGLVRLDDGGGLRWRVPPPHLGEFFHYYLGTKYFDVLGYTGLYDAVVLADLEDVPERFRPAAQLRDLVTNAPQVRADAIDRALEVKARFAPARWEAFKRDLAVLRGAVPPDFWDLRGYVQDHGYNGTPLVTAVLGTLARSPLPIREFVDVFRWMDVWLLVLAGAVVAGILGPAPGLGFLVVAFANPLNDHPFIGSAYLRYGYLLALVGALLALRERRGALAGVCFALACGLRIFPAVLYGAYLLHALLRPDRRERLRAQRPTHVAFALTGAAILAATAPVDTPSGRFAWREFAQNLSVHAGTPSGNLVGLQTPFAYAPAKDRHPDPEDLTPTPAADRFDWAGRTREVLDARWLPRWIAGILLAAAGLAALRRVPEIRFVVPALLLVFVLQPLSHYYWAMLSLVPLSLPHPPAAAGSRRLLAGALALLVAIAAADALAPKVDLRFALASAVVGALLLALCWRSARGAGALAAAALLAAAGCAEPPGPPTIEGDTYRSRALGFAVDKPADWHFGEVTSLERDTEERVRELERLWELLEMQVLTPLVLASPAADARLGRDPMFRVFVIPRRPDDSARAAALVEAVELTSAVTTFAHNRSRFEDFEVTRPARAVTVGNDREAAAIDIRYAVPRDDGDPLPVRERLSLVRRGGELWYFSQLQPEPATPEVEARLAEMLASVRLDD